MVGLVGDVYGEGIHRAPEVVFQFLARRDRIEPVLGQPFPLHVGINLGGSGVQHDVLSRQVMDGADTHFVPYRQGERRVLEHGCQGNHGCAGFPVQQQARIPHPEVSATVQQAGDDVLRRPCFEDFDVHARSFVIALFFSRIVAGKLESMLPLQLKANER